MKTRLIQIASQVILTIFIAFPVVAGDNICPIPPDPPELIYDPANPTSMDPGTTENIRVIGGVEPLTWTSSNPDYTFSNQTTINRTNPLTSALTTCGEVTVTISDSRINPYDGTPNPQVVSGMLNKPFEFDWGPDGDLTVGTLQTVEVDIKGGLAPFTWTISGTDFYIDNLYENPAVNKFSSITTNSRTVIIYADEYSCAADITVSDSCGVTLNASIRNVDSIGGRWALIEDIRDQVNYPGDACPNDGTITGKEGGHFWANGGYYWWSRPYLKGKYYIPEEYVQGWPISHNTSCDTKSWDACHGCLIGWENCASLGFGGGEFTDYCTWKGGKYYIHFAGRQKYEWICN
jgi:hypothetical protein